MAAEKKQAEKKEQEANMEAQAKAVAKEQQAARRRERAALAKEQLIFMGGDRVTKAQLIAQLMETKEQLAETKEQLELAESVQRSLQRSLIDERESSARQAERHMREAADRRLANRSRWEGALVLAAGLLGVALIFVAAMPTTTP
jgi:hypothetical protein